MFELRYLCKKELERIEQSDLVILVDFGLKVLDAQSRSILMDIMVDRHDRKSTIVVGQVPVSSWHEVISDATWLVPSWTGGSMGPFRLNSVENTCGRNHQPSESRLKIF